MRYPTPGTGLTEFLPAIQAAADGTLLAVLPVSGGTARLAIVGYLLPVAPGEQAPAADAGAVPSGLAAVTPAAPAGLAAGLVTEGDLPGVQTAGAHAARGPLPGGLLVDTAQRRVLVDGCDTDLVYQEFELLRFLMAHPGQAFTRSQLAERAWGEPQPDGSRTVDVHVHRLRRKLGPAYGSRLRTVRRVGYLYQPPSACPA